MSPGSSPASLPEDALSSRREGGGRRTPGRAGLSRSQAHRQPGRPGSRARGPAPAPPPWRPQLRRAQSPPPRPAPPRPPSGPAKLPPRAKRGQHAERKGPVEGVLGFKGDMRVPLPAQSYFDHLPEHRVCQGLLGPGNARATVGLHHPVNRPPEGVWSALPITLYEGKHFTGRKLEVFGDCDNFQDRGFMNRVNSIRVESGAWVCFDHPDFRGQQFILEHGDYPDFFRWNGHNDHMGSCRPVGMHGEHFRLEIFEGCNFTGQCLEFLEDCPFLQSGGWAKNCVNAIKVYGDGAWVLYEEPNYRGRMYVVERGDFRSFSDWEAHSARVQSLRRVVNFF
ncbi:gamma-crystallin N [Carlito syrichta]|uniref:Gamma-crystallin N n=1 Tax=Carlito syrichta TaxID=1868482 RepID=A0A3Q0DHS1_CARSF|nr:gamma-crystallin N [Carlito syrichta]